MKIKKGVRKLIAVTLATAMGLSLALTGGGSKMQQVEAAAGVEPPAVQDAASQVNYSTILGRGVDFGIVAGWLEQRMHMQTTFAVKTYANQGQNNDINLIAEDSTAQVMFGGVDTTSGAPLNQIIQIGSVSGSHLNIECSPGMMQYFDTSHADVNNKLSFIENPATNDNIQKIMDNAFEKSAELERKAKSGYAINYHDYLTSNGSIDISGSEFVDKVVYIDVDNALLQTLVKDENSNIRLIKDESTVVVFNISEEAGTNSSWIEKKSGQTVTGVTIGKYKVSVDHGATWAATDSYDNPHDSEESAKNDKYICQKVIWNVRTSKNVGLENTSGLFIIPNSALVETRGTSAGWVVTQNFANSYGEWHYIYTAGNQEVMKDGVGQIHFAARKGFTHEWDGKATAEDTTIFAAEEEYKFKWFENDKNFSKDETDPTKYVEVKNTKTSKLQFPTLSFYTKEQDAIDAGEETHYIAEGEEKEYYYTVRELNAGTKTSDGIYISEGKIDIKLTVRNVSGKFEYYVDTTTYLGDGEIYKENKDVRMSGVEFSMGAFLNLAETSLVLKKTVTGDCDAAKNATFTYFVQDTNGHYYGTDGKNKGTTETPISIKAGESVEIKDLPSGKYTVKEDIETASFAGYTLVAPEQKIVSVGATATPVVNLTNDYIQTSLKVTKEVKALLDEREDIPAGAKGWTYKFYVESVDFTNPQMYIGQNGELTENKYLFDVKATGPDAEFTINPLVAGNYKIVEDTSNLNIPGNYALSTSYDDQTVTIDKDKKDAESKIINTYRKTNDLSIIIEKKLDGVSSSDKEYEFYLSYYDESQSSTVYVGADGKKQYTGYGLGRHLSTKEEATTLKVKAGTPLKLTGNESDQYNAIWGDTYNSNGTTYTIEEVEPTGSIRVDGVEYFFVSVDGNNAQKTLKNDSNQVFEVTNKYQKYELVLEKKVNMPELEGQEFGFVVKGPDGRFRKADGSIFWDSTEISQAPVIPVKAGKQYVLNGNGIFAGEYTVTEVAPEIGGVITVGTHEYELKSVTGNNGTATLSPTSPEGKVTITNTFEKKQARYGELTVSKEKSATSEAFPKNDITFPITVSFNKGGTYWVNGSPRKFEKDVAATFHLAEGGSVEFTNIPADVEYVVGEVLNGADYTGFESPQITYSNTTKKISADGEDTVTVSNTYKNTTTPKGSLVIEKTISGASLNELETIRFTGVGDDSSTLTIPDLTYNNVLAQTWKDEGNGKYSYTIDNLDVGVKYTITETLDGTANTQYKLDATASTVTPVESGAIDATTPVTVVITDAYKKATGDLVLTKSITGPATQAEAEGALTFQITTGTGTDKKYVTADGTLTSTETTLKLTDKKSDNT
ncbi:MAG: DUF5979 domain-containing protein, partial [Eubacterium sp.]|nr:DUF5979 domain-containing protein [Eubacterium sp.]